MESVKQPFDWNRTTTDLDDNWFLMAETGWDFLILRAAGVNNVGRKQRVKVPLPLVRVVVIRSGVEHVHYEEQTPYDRAVIRDSLVSVLRDADVPPPPPGFDWFIRIPSGTTREKFFQQFNGRLMTAKLPNVPHPSEWLPVMMQELQDLYLADGTAIRVGNI